jgi:hypothetical protein
MKGQAFDTFKLLIAAVVAIAILGILLSIIGNMPNVTTNPTTAIKNALTDAYNSPGVPSVSPSKAQFKKNINFAGNLETFTSVVGGSTIAFSCSQYLIDSATCAGGGTLMIKKDFQAYVSAICCGTSSCFVIVGNDTAACP